MDRRRAGVLALCAVVAACGSSGDQTAAPSAANGDAWFASEAAVSTKTSDAVSATLPGEIAQVPQGFGLQPGGAHDVASFHGKIASGIVPLPEDLDIEGWLNERGTQVPAADPTHPIDLHALVGVHAAAPAAQPDVIVQLGFSTAQSLQALQPPVALVVALDTSGSMAGVGRTLLQQAILRVFETLPVGSQFGLVEFADGVAESHPLQVTGTAAHDKLKDTLQNLSSGGGTDLHAGLEAALKMLQSAPQGAERVVLLLTDGGPTVGEGADAVLALAKTTTTHVSTVAVGDQAATALLAAVAGKTGGVAKKATVQTLGDALVAGVGPWFVPVADDLKVELTLAKGWTMNRVFGFSFTQIGDVVTLGQATTPTVGPQPGVDASSAPPDVKATDVALLSTLYAAPRNGLVLARLQPPGDLSPVALHQLQFATVHWSYRLTKTGEKLEHERAVKVADLVAIPDGGLVYFESPVVRRAFALLKLGEVTRKALETWQSLSKDAAVSQMDAVLSFAGDQVTALGQDDPDHDVLLAAQELQDLRVLMAATKSP